MKRKIGSVTLDYTYYKGDDLYTDGEIEDTLLNIVKNKQQDTILYESNEWPILYHLSNIRENLLEWYPFEQDSDILEIGAGCGAITGLLSRKANSVTCIELSEKRSLINAYKNSECQNVTIMIGNFQDIQLDRKFDYITLIGVWEYAGLYVEGDNPYEKLLRIVKQFLKEDGKIIVAIENKMGMKYFNGAREDHTGKFYLGINDYVCGKHIRTFSQPEIIKILNKLGIQKYCFYYPMPDYKLPDTIYSDVILPNPGNIRYYAQEYSMDRIYNFYDATAFDQVSADGMFPYFANSFLFVCGEDEKKSFFSKYSRERKSQFRISTIISEIDGEKVVVKKPLSDKAIKHVRKMKEHEDNWKKSDMPFHFVEGHLVNNAYVVPYIDGISLDELLYEWRNNASAFVTETRKLLDKYVIPKEDKFVRFIKTKEFENVFGPLVPENSKSLRTTNIDITLSNLKIDKEGCVYNFDYEWVFDFNIPFEYVLWRILVQLYEEYRVYLKWNISLTDFLDALGISKENIPIYRDMENCFAEYVFGKKREEEYLKKYRKKILSQKIEG